MFTAGTPVHSLDEDALGRKRFARRLAEALLAYNKNESLCVAIYGTWGTGKSSLMNLTEQMLHAELTGSRPILVRFNPWNYSGQDYLVQQFFQTLLVALDRPDLSKKYSKVSAWIRKLSVMLKPVEFSPWPPISYLAYLIGRAVTSIARLFTSAAYNEQTLEALKAKISTELVVQGRRVIIIVDDIDRLTDIEIRETFQLVKSLADFSNVIYLMAFDRPVVEHALDDMQGGDGPSYLEKIINVPIELPPIQARSISKLLVERLNATLASKHDEYAWEDNSRLNSILSELPSAFRTIRSLDRLSNLLSFAEPLVATEVDFADLIAITSLQVLVPDCYYFVRHNPHIFVESVEARLLRTEESDREERRQLDEMIQSCGAEFGGSRRLRDLLTSIFPRIGDRWDRPYDNDTQREWIRQKRACANVELFQTYFALDVPDEDLSSAQLRAVLDSLATNQFEDNVRRLIAESKGIAFLDSFLNYVEEPAVQLHVGLVVQVLFNVSDLFGRDGRGFPIVLDGHTLILQLVYQIVRRIPDEARRFTVLHDAIRACTASLFGPVHTVSIEDQAANRYNSGGSGDSSRRLVSDVQLDTLEADARHLIETWAVDGRLALHPELAYILYRWSNWGGGHLLHSYVIETLTDEQFVKLLVRIGSRSSRRPFSDIPRLHADMVEPLAPLLEVRRRLEEIVATPERVALLPDDLRNPIALLLGDPSNDAVD